MEHNILSFVTAAQGDVHAADALVRQYLPFIKSETAKFIHRPPMEGQDDELSVAMFAFHEAVMRYSKEKGAFLSFAALQIRSRLIDYFRKEKRHGNQISLNQPLGEEDGATLLDKMDTGEDNISLHQVRRAAKEEILEFGRQLEKFGLSLSDIAENCPKQERTLSACHAALQYAKVHSELLTIFLETKRLPLK
ncbi:MAG: sigma factor, partial [Bacillota bacterium]|nr:sigma factor [Bacillota bacterium]